MMGHFAGLLLTLLVLTLLMLNTTGVKTNVATTVITSHSSQDTNQWEPILSLFHPLVYVRANTLPHSRPVKLIKRTHRDFDRRSVECLDQASFHQVKGGPTFFFGVLQFVTPFTHDSRYLVALKKKQKKICRKKLF